MSVIGDTPLSGAQLDLLVLTSPPLSWLPSLYRIRQWTDAEHRAFRSGFEYQHVAMMPTGKQATTPEYLVGDRVREQTTAYHRVGTIERFDEEGKAIVRWDGETFEVDPPRWCRFWPDNADLVWLGRPESPR